MPGTAVLDRGTAETYASWFRALADPTRVQIVRLLAQHGAPMSVGTVVRCVAVSQPTVSSHLKILAVARLVHAERQGTARLYQLNPEAVASFLRAADFITSANPHTTRIAPGGLISVDGRKGKA